MFKYTPLVIGLLIIAAAPVRAEVISIADPRYDVPNDTSGVIRPTRGMSMSAVLKHYGEPTSKSPAVGEPPITRWTYPSFVVFFEHNIVLHAVIPH